MPRYNVKSNDPNITVSIGWDAPMQTFFAQVERINPDDEDDEPEMLVWEGTKPSQHKHLGFILPKLEPYCIVPEDMLRQLAADQQNSTQPSSLQQDLMQRLFLSW
jgi:hypothetical protein